MRKKKSCLKNCPKGFLSPTALFLSKMIISPPSGSNESKSAKEKFQFGLSPKAPQSWLAYLIGKVIYVSYDRFEINQNQISGQQWGIFQAHFLLTKTKTPFHLSRNPKVFFNQFKKHGHSYIVGFHSAGLTVLSIICRERFFEKKWVAFKVLRQQLVSVRILEQTI